ncbi:ergothioneine biosynthesis protein EgtB [Acuticoccus sp. M5D2P5]|uniref:ergothioneine biosynthesis protein EgtB n=1 Tax=Acuticoccus kalidii TaxID=2910977 RepID=UPI001F42CE91|nr:ergothioneine biosynthesis protein EgtB [Acuticoccus kalidii]MCF3935956.1 ergothioneine biosynthesis protein EgtB [Acuticoccus kalidii]
MRLTKADRAPKGIAALFARTRARTGELASRLSPEDMVVQSMPDASPAKWHLAHTTWFFETFVLKPYEAGFRLYDERFPHCFNSYYAQAGTRHARPMRGMLTRPSAAEVLAYREAVEERVAALIADPPAEHRAEIERRVELGCHHEMQHQELLLTDILHAFSLSPLEPAYLAPAPIVVNPDLGAADWHSFEGGIVPIGTEERFSFDNEGPRHDALVHPFRIAGRLVTAGEWAAFIADGGYETETLWLSDGWGAVQREGWTAPMYWRHEDGAWWTFSLRGPQLVDMTAPVHHVSYYEADAFARWAGKRLPSEFEWELASADAVDDGHYLDGGFLRPRPTETPAGLRQMAGEVWQWTQSSYAPYPGFRPVDGALGEYNGKFMVSQYVLRGASFGTARDHVRPTYRNFFHPHLRWQFAGLRLAEDL